MHGRRGARAAVLTPRDDIDALVRRALAEDVGTGDLTAQLIPPGARARAAIITREAAILCGRDWFDAVFSALDPNVRIQWSAKDGDSLTPNGQLCTLEGAARSLLTGERPALNFLQTLSGTATVTRSYVEAVAGSGCRILDTRKTIPGLRLAQKYAVLCGGGMNHRIGLYDGILIKENHIAAAGSITAAVTAARQLNADVLLEVEVENLDQLREALEAAPHRILLDNFNPEQMRLAVGITRASGRRVELEASGNMALDTVRAVAATGVDYISVGSLTKNVRAVDLSMRFTSQ